jgi:serine/threonine protein kinase
MSKAKIIDKKSEKSVIYEKELLRQLKHPYFLYYYKYNKFIFRFLVNMQYAFQDYENLYLIMDLLSGGDLRYHISRHKKFSEEQTSK